MPEDLTAFDRAKLPVESANVVDEMSETERAQPGIESKEEPAQQQHLQTDSSEPAQTEPQRLQGWRLHVLTVGIWIALFLSTLETTIVSTSLVSITNALEGFIIRDWVVTAYLLTYTGFLTIYAKLSDIFGRKTMLVLGLVIFIIFSALCGASNDMVELVVLRAFQGMGASGIYSMVMVIAPSLIPPAKFAQYMAVISTVFILASVLGPVLGGVINNSSSWRWVFYLNIPGGIVALVIIIIFLPPSTPASGLSIGQRVRKKFAKSALIRVDYFGMFLLLASSVLLIFALEEGGTRFPWNSAAIIATLVLAISTGIIFAGWEWFIDGSRSVQEPVFPPSILGDRLISAMMLTAFFIGFPFVAVVVNIPQRAQAVAGDSPLNAGLVLLPLLLTSPFATVLSGVLTSNLKVPPFYIITVSGALQLIGIGLTISLPTDATSVPASQYGFEVLMGIGFGLGLTTLLTFARAVISEKNLAVMMGGITHVRVLGGTISLAICAAMLNNYLTTNLSSVITPEQLRNITDSLAAINYLTPEEQIAVKRAFSEGYHRQNIFLTALTAIGFITSLFLWEKNPRIA